MESFFDYLFSMLGFSGCIMFAFCNVPQVAKVYRDKNAYGLSNAFLVMQLLGNLFNFLYVEYTNCKNNVWQYPMYLNYSIAFALIVTLILMKNYYDKKKNKT